MWFGGIDTGGPKKETVSEYFKMHYSSKFLLQDDFVIFINVCLKQKLST